MENAVQQTVAPSGNGSDTCYRVRFEFRKVQSFLFDIPRVRAMLGANALFGETVRFRLVSLYLDIVRSEPEAARKRLNQLLKVGWETGSGRSSEAEPDQSDEDDYQQRRGREILMEERMQGLTGFAQKLGLEWVADNPALAFKAGVLAREGGHFNAMFADEACARRYITAVKPLLHRWLPGLTCSVWFDALNADGSWTELDASTGSGAAQTSAPDSEQFLFDTPWWQPCVLNPSLPAASKERLPGSDTSLPVSTSAWRKYDTGRLIDPAENTKRSDAAKQRICLDNVSLLQDHLPLYNRIANTRLQYRTAQDFHELSRVTFTSDNASGLMASSGTVSGFMAVIHCDGNSIGKRVEALNSDKGEVSSAQQAAAEHSHQVQTLQREARIESFFYQMRSLVRESIVEALKCIFPEPSADDEPSPEDSAKDNNSERPASQPRPYQLMMSAGDDMLLVCRADKALPFVVELARCVEAASRKHTGASDGDKQYAYPAFKDNPLTLGAGVVISHCNVPFWRLHEMAESLASNAKQLFRARQLSTDAAGGSVDPVSVVDWAIFTESWSDDPIQRRSEEQVFVEQSCTYATTRKPYQVLRPTNPETAEGGQADDSASHSLEQLLVAADALGKQKNKEALGDREGVARSQLRKLPSALAGGAAQAQLSWLELPAVQREHLADVLGLHNPMSPWEKVDEQRHYSRLVDFIELVEIPYLGYMPSNPAATSLPDTQRTNIEHRHD